MHKKERQRKLTLFLCTQRYSKKPSGCSWRGVKKEQPEGFFIYIKLLSRAVSRRLQRRFRLRQLRCRER